MSILSNSLPTNGQPLLAQKASATQDVHHYLPRIFQLDSSKKNSLDMVQNFSENKNFIQIDNDRAKLDNQMPFQVNICLSVTVSSAVKLDGRQIELINRKMQKLTGFRNLRIENIVDPSLIAGFTIRYADDESNVIDLSVKGQLASLAARVENLQSRELQIM